MQLLLLGFGAMEIAWQILFSGIDTVGNEGILDVDCKDIKEMEAFDRWSPWREDGVDHSTTAVEGYSTTGNQLELLFGVGLSNGMTHQSDAFVFSLAMSEQAGL